MSGSPPAICVFASSLVLTVTVEAAEADDGDEIHIHPGGQGFWIARMIDRLGELLRFRPRWAVSRGKLSLPWWQIRASSWSPTDRPDESPIYIHDRRSGKRVSFAEQLEPGLSRHETDDLYSRTLETALATGTVVVTGRYGAGGIPEFFYSRLGADLASLGLKVVGDMHGPELDAFLKEGQLNLLKVSADDLIADGAIEGDGEEELRSAIQRLVDKGAQGVVVSGGSDGSAIAQVEGSWFRVEQTRLEAADHRGLATDDCGPYGWTAPRSRHL